jgi:LEA14-like dessication related protein
MKRRDFYALPVVLFIFLFIAACQQPEVPEYLGLQDIQVMKLDAQQSVLSGSVKFYNPNAFDMQLKKADINIYLNDQLANHYLLDSTIEIHAKDSFWIPVKLQVDLKNIFSNAIQSLLNDQVRIRLEGHARVKKGGIGFRVPIHYEEKQKLSSLLQGSTPF